MGPTHWSRRPLPRARPRNGQRTRKGQGALITLFHADPPMIPSKRESMSASGAPAGKRTTFEGRGTIPSCQLAGLLQAWLSPPRHVTVLPFTIGVSTVASAGRAARIPRARAINNTIIRIWRSLLLSTSSSVCSEPLGRLGCRILTNLKTHVTFRPCWTVTLRLPVPLARARV